VRFERQRGSSLVEVTVAIAIVAIAAGAALGALLSTGRHHAQRDRRAILEEDLRSELAVAVDIVKYSGGALVPATVATSLPMPAGSPLAATISLTIRHSGTATQIQVTAQTIDGMQRAMLGATVAAQAPLPDATLLRGGLVPAPTGAP
jgi:prepilin-type N-terminal cleavage/methylation domain-containing protein